MCGISGQYNFATGKQVDPAVIRRMADSLVHRGPDEQGSFIDQALGLGFRRLSIIDLASFSRWCGSGLRGRAELL